MPTATERTPLIGTNDDMIHDSTPLEVVANELLRAGERGINATMPNQVDITHEVASCLYALHIVERHDQARGSARAAAYRASETLRTRVALRHRAVAALDAALRYCDTEQHFVRDEDDDDVLALSRPLPVKGKCTTREYQLALFVDGACWPWRIATSAVFIVIAGLGVRMLHPVFPQPYPHIHPSHPNATMLTTQSRRCLHTTPHPARCSTTRSSAPACPVHGAARGVPDTTASMNCVDSWIGPLRLRELVLYLASGFGTRRWC